MKEDDNLIRNKSFTFAEEIIHICTYMIRNEREYVLGKQLMKSGTSIGANIEEAMQAQSRNDFISKLQISLKEAYENRYWIKLIVRTGYVKAEKMQHVRNEIESIIRILVAIIRSSKRKANT